MLFRPSAKARISAGLALLLVSVLLVAISFRLVPDRRAAEMHGRIRLCELIAVNSSLLLTSKSTREVEASLREVVRMNDDLLSAAIRKSDGTTVAEIGEHTNNWIIDAERKPGLDAQVEVPIFDESDNKWGSVEVRFQPLSQSGFWGFLSQPWSGLLLFVPLVSYLVFYLYLGKMLKQLDPSKAIPARVRSALDTITGGLIVMDRSERIVLANQAFAQAIDESPDAMVGRKVRSLGWQTDGNEGPTPWSKVLETEETCAGQNVRLQSKNREMILVANCAPIFGQTGNLRGVLASFEDVTMLETQKDELSEAKAAAEAANSAKSEFLARMSHEIRTPMNAILGFTDVLRRGLFESEDEVENHLDTIHASGQHLLDLINDILDLSKVEAGRMEIERIECQPTQLVTEVANVLRVRADGKSIDLRTSAKGKIPTTMISDPIRIKQVLMNLIGNAIKFTSEGHVEIVMRLAKSESGQTLLAFDIVDTGVGIKEEAIERIFDPFAQADTSVTRKFGGTGLGLAISRKLVSALGGTMTVRSKVNVGSVFSFTIDPGDISAVEMCDGDSINFADSGRRNLEEDSIELPDCRILIAEDGVSNRKLLTLVLNRAGANVESAENGQIALEMSSASDYDVILMDMQMPVMDGYTATQRIRETGSAIPIVALTAHAMAEDEAKCLAAGCTHFLTKPIDISLLIRTLQQILGYEPKDEWLEFLEQGMQNTEQLPIPNDGPIISALPADDRDFMEVIEEFADKVVDQVELMRYAFSASNYPELGNLAHWLKGSGGMAGFPQFTKPSEALEKLVKSEQKDSEKMLEMLDEIQKICDRIKVIRPEGQTVDTA